MSTSRRTRGLSGLAVVAGLAVAAAGCVTGCASSGGSPGSRDAAARTTTVAIELTPAGCAPKPARIPAGPVQFTVANKDAGAVSEAELRTSDLAEILGEQENLTPGLSGGFSLDIQPGSYKISCPGAARANWDLTVTGRASGPSWSTSPQLTAAVPGYVATCASRPAPTTRSSPSIPCGT